MTITSRIEHYGAGRIFHATRNGATTLCGKSANRMIEPPPGYDLWPPDAGTGTVCPGCQEAAKNRGTAA